MNPPDGLVPFEPSGQNLEAELRRLARAILINRHRDIPVDLIDDMIESVDELNAEYNALINQMRKPVAPDYPRRGGIMFFEVTESPEGEVSHGGRRYAIVRQYDLNYVPNRPRHSIAPWALHYGQSSRS